MRSWAGRFRCSGGPTSHLETGTKPRPHWGGPCVRSTSFPEATGAWAKRGRWPRPPSMDSRPGLRQPEPVAGPAAAETGPGLPEIEGVEAGLEIVRRHLGDTHPRYLRLRDLLTSAGARRPVAEDS